MDTIDKYATILWEALKIQEQPNSEECLWIFGSTDVVVPAYAAALYFQINPEIIICSGGIAHETDELNTGWNESEGEIFKRVLVGFGVPATKILVEPRAKNTAQNFSYSSLLLEPERLRKNSHLIVQKPYMTLRTKLTGVVAAPELKFKVCAPDISYTDYCKLFMPRDRLVNIMVGDFQRIGHYAKLGYSAPFQFSGEAMDAFKNLKKLGCTKHLIR